MLLRAVDHASAKLNSTQSVSKQQFHCLFEPIRQHLFVSVFVCLCANRVRGPTSMPSLRSSWPEATQKYKPWTRRIKPVSPRNRTRASGRRSLNLKSTALRRNHVLTLRSLQAVFGGSHSVWHVWPLLSHPCFSGAGKPSAWERGS